MFHLICCIWYIRLTKLRVLLYRGLNPFSLFFRMHDTIPLIRKFPFTGEGELCKLSRENFMCYAFFSFFFSSCMYYDTIESVRR